MLFSCLVCLLSQQSTLSWLLIHRTPNQCHASLRKKTQETDVSQFSFACNHYVIANKMQPNIVYPQGSNDSINNSHQRLRSHIFDSQSELPPGGKSSLVHVMCLCPKAPGLRCQGYGHQRHNTALWDGHLTTWPLLSIPGFQGHAHIFAHVLSGWWPPLVWSQWQDDLAVIMSSLTPVCPLIP